jgi:glycosyltransferase involved in cell wall biosynthesis
MTEWLADTVICVSSAVERHFSGRGRARIVVIPDGVEVPPAREHARDGFRDPLRLCLVGGVAGRRGKGQDIAVEALGRLDGLGVRATLDLVGPVDSPDFAEELQRRADALGVGERLRVRGWVDDAGRELAKADIVLLCSRAEALPLTVMEALARERPVVATDVGGVRELVTDGETGFVVERENPDAVADAVVRLTQDPAGAFEMARRGRELVVRRYSVEAAIAALRGEVERMLIRGRA